MLIPPTLPLHGDAHLRPFARGDAEALVDVISANLDHLRPWMGWVHDYDPAMTREYVRRSVDHEDPGAQFAIMHGDALAGSIGFHAFDWLNRSTSIGYWIGAAHQGHGIVTAAVRALSALAFDDWGLHRIQLRAAPDNARSQAIAERCGFVREGVAREAELIGSGFRDLVVYALLSS